MCCPDQLRISEAARLPDRGLALNTPKWRVLAPWWMRWPSWWSDQKRMIRAFCGSSGKYHQDEQHHHLVWQGKLPFACQGRKRKAPVQIVWAAGTPFVPPRIIPERRFSKRHQLSDDSMCLMAPNDARAGWEGVMDIHYWLKRAAGWLRGYEAENWAISAQEWELHRFMLPRPRYRLDLPEMFLLGLSMVRGCP